MVRAAAFRHAFIFDREGTAIEKSSFMNLRLEDSGMIGKKEIVSRLFVNLLILSTSLMQ